MDFNQIAVVATLALTLVLFAWGHWRYDLVALVSLLALVLLGVIPDSEAFRGFGHPAIITVAAMLVISAALEKAGIVDIIAARITQASSSLVISMMLQTGAVTVMSAFMNNIGALALMLPVALQVARRIGVHPGYFLMPLAFGSILGGLLTMIGTPPNIIIATFRQEAMGESFGIFDFTPVGLLVALAGLLVIAGFARFLIPIRGGNSDADVYAQLEPYLTELAVPEDSAFSGERLRVFREAGDDDIAVVAMIRDGERILSPHGNVGIRPEDTFIVEADPDSLRAFMDKTGARITAERHFGADLFSSEDVVNAEVVVLPGSRLERRTAAGIRLRSSYGINLLGVARQGASIRTRLGHVRLRVGDVLLVQGDSDTIRETCAALECLPLEQRGVAIRRSFSPVPILVFCAALIASAVGVVPIQVSLSLAAVLMVLANFLSMREMYDAIDWPIIVLLGALVPVGATLDSTGVTQLIGQSIVGLMGASPALLVVPLLMIIAIALSNVVNNAATAILMAPLAINIANGLDVSADPFLMAVAIGSSCAFVTPIGHQSNLLVMGPGGYEFRDYWKLGLPVSLVAVLVGSPAILLFWSL
ncbi:MAG: SLC13 family permease [Alphaproteobacteria bacterium]